MSVELKWKIPKIPLFNASKATKVIDKEAVRSLNIMTEVVRTNTVFSAPKGVTGRLSRFATTVTPRKGRVFPTVKYAGVIEGGRKAAPVAMSANLKAWILRSSKGKRYFASLKSRYPKITVSGAAFLLRRSMKRKPRKPNPFFSRAIKRSEKRLRLESGILNRRIAVGFMTEGLV